MAHGVGASKLASENGRARVGIRRHQGGLLNSAPAIRDRELKYHPITPSGRWTLPDACFWLHPQIGLVRASRDRARCPEEPFSFSK